MRQDSDVLEFAVEDTGVGIAPHDIPRIFHEFQQLDGSTKRRHEGAGLGLAISRRFVELHGGRIWVDSRPGQGSTFSFSLPLKQDGHIPGSTISAELSQVSHTGRPGDPVILSVTSSLAGARLLSRHVHGVRTVTVSDVGQIQAAVHSLMPQAVVIDAEAQGADPSGLPVLARTLGALDVPFVICPLPREHAIHNRVPVDGFLVKPVTSQALWDVLRQYGENLDRVLVVDDSREFVMLLGRMLDSPVRRYQSISAYSGREALDLLRRHRPGLVLLDLGLPDFDDAELVSRIRATPEGRRVPIVIMSGQDEIDQEETLHGSVTIARYSGLRPGEIVRLIEATLGLVGH